MRGTRLGSPESAGAQLGNCSSRRGRGPIRGLRPERQEYTKTLPLRPSLGVTSCGPGNRRGSTRHLIRPSGAGNYVEARTRYSPEEVTMRSASRVRVTSREKWTPVAVCPMQVRRPAERPVSSTTSLTSHGQHLDVVRSGMSCCFTCEWTPSDSPGDAPLHQLP